MKVAVFSTKSYDQYYLQKANRKHGHGHDLTFFEPRLIERTASLAVGHEAVCAFVNDRLNADVLRTLHAQGTELIALRSAGFNHVDLDVASELGLTVVRVPAYSPHAVAEHALALILGLNRKIFRAYNRVREGNFSLEGLLGFDLYGKRVGVVGTGKIGRIFARIMAGLGTEVLAFDPYPSREAEPFVRYVPLAELFGEADIISLHCPLTPETHHLIDDGAIAVMKDGVMLINTSRGQLVDTRAVIDGLKSGRIGHLGLDVYEEEEELFFEDLSDRVIRDDVFTRLLTFPNVLITGHQGFFTEEAVANIAETTLANISAFESGTGTIHRVTAEKVA
ncbi:MAG: 2-hydroxyacid dehydrogenase [Trueperaceae bacterium]|nr:MAG: 2-hydroxyacid dehydrogenase [Trueperaceae bacterium]